MQITVSKYKFHKRRNKETIGEVASTPMQVLNKQTNKTNKKLWLCQNVSGTNLMVPCLTITMKQFEHLSGFG